MPPGGSGQGLPAGQAGNMPGGGIFREVMLSVRPGTDYFNHLSNFKWKGYRYHSFGNKIISGSLICLEDLSAQTVRKNLNGALNVSNFRIFGQISIQFY